jgi:hypothetical protein
MNTTTNLSLKLSKIDPSQTLEDWQGILLSSQLTNLEYGAFRLKEEFLLLEFWKRILQLDLGIDAVTVLREGEDYEWGSAVTLLEISTTESSLPLWVGEELQELLPSFSLIWIEGAHSYYFNDRPSLNDIKADYKVFLYKHIDQFEKMFDVEQESG